jgi:predicted DNA-binding transcriptional regulator YafY
MRASRLLSILLLLQARGRMTAECLAVELEVSVRTIYRDIEALHESGVALYGEPGRDGGYRLVDGYRTQLTGLTQDEAAALSLAAMPAAARELGLSGAAAGAAAKLNAALSDDLRRRSDHIQGRLYFDPSAWYDDTDRISFLTEVAEAVWQQRRLRATYVRWDEPREVLRVLEPYGLVLKGGRWYVVARSGAQLRTYRVSQFRDARLLDERFERPAEFDLAAYWSEYLTGFTTRRHHQHATVWLSPRGWQRLNHLMEPAVVKAVAASAVPASRDGWVEATLPIESIGHAHDELLRLGAEVEVLAPTELRDLIARTAHAMARRYRNAGRVSDKVHSGLH